jgi:hypothetical protein
MKMLLAVLCLAGSIGSVAALERGNTDLGGPYLSGGVGSTEMETIDGERIRYDLSILAAARGSGDFLADVHIRITDSHDRSLLDTVMDGPWLLVDLPPGRYEIDATRNLQVQKRIVSLTSNRHHESVFYFDNRSEDATPAP